MLRKEKKRKKKEEEAKGEMHVHVEFHELHSPCNFKFERKISNSNFGGLIMGSSKARIKKKNPAMKIHVQVRCLKCCISQWGPPCIQKVAINLILGFKIF